ncbi:unnamed protein product [Rhizophagus irregularis]|nr:unnamed protein product [Rhizophagus irregularis]
MSSSTNVDIDFSSTSYELLKPYPQLDVVSNIGSNIAEDGLATDDFLEKNTRFQKNLPSTIPVVTSMLSSSPSLRSQHHGNIFTYSFHTCKLNPYVVRDTRGSGTLYNTKKGRYFLIELDQNADLLLTKKNSFNIYTNDIDMTNDHHRIFNSTSKKVNVNFLIGTYLTFIFAINRQFSPDTINKYFKRLRQLLLEKLIAIKNRISQPSKNRTTKTFIRFSAGAHVIYLGYYFRCDLDCAQPAAVVLSQNRWKCNHHLGSILGVSPEKKKSNLNIPGYRSRFDSSHNHWKEIHSTRLGVTYDVIVRRYNEWRGKKDNYLQTIMEPTATTTKKGVKSARFYYKEYSGLQFDVNRTQSQLDRWNRLVNSIINSERYLYNPKPFLINKNSTVFKKIQHAVERSPLSRITDEDKYAEKIIRKRAKNWKHRVKKRNKLKKKLPDLPPNFTGDAHAFYFTTYNINLYVYNVRRRFDLSRLPGFKYSYPKAKRNYNKHQIYKKNLSRSRTEVEQSASSVVNDPPCEIHKHHGYDKAESPPIPEFWSKILNTRSTSLNETKRYLNEEINLPDRNTPPPESTKIIIDNPPPRPIARPRRIRKELPPTLGPDL